jgi:BRCA1-associated protein
MSLYRLKGCPAKNINRLVSLLTNYSQYSNEEQYNKQFEYYINDLSYKVVNKYTINECISIILYDNKNILDAIKKSNGVQLNLNDPLMFHRQLAFPYVKDWIITKVNSKISYAKLKKSNDDIVCSICLEGFTNSRIKVTKCKHIFHIDCLNKWGRSTCPMCRSNI